MAYTHILQKRVGSGAITGSARSLSGGYNGSGVSVDNTNNVYVSGYDTRKGVILNYNESGVLTWQRAYGPGGSLFYWAFGVCSNNLGDVYLTGSIDLGSSNYDYYLLKYNSSGVLQWQMRYGNSAIDRGYSVACDDSGNLYLTGYDYDTGPTKAYCVTLKIDPSDGSVIWQKRLYVTADESVEGRGIAIDSSGNAYVAGFHGLGSTIINFIAKFDTSGNLQWHKRTHGKQLRDCAIDSNDNLYSVGYNSISGYAILVKYNSSGVFQWYKQINDSTSIFNGIGIDSSDNIYATGVYTEGVEKLLIVKFNDVGDVLFQRSLSGPTTDEEGSDVGVTANGYMYITGHWDGTKMLVTRLPADGSGLGTYGSLVYEETTFTTSSVSENTDPTTLLVTTGGFNALTATGSENPGTLTETTT